MERNAAEILKILLEAGADAARTDYFNFTLLHRAALSDSADVIEPLVKAGLDVNAKTGFGTTPLGGIKAKGFTRTEEKLRQYGGRE